MTPFGRECITWSSARTATVVSFLPLVSRHFSEKYLGRFKSRFRDSSGIDFFFGLPESRRTSWKKKNDEEHMMNRFQIRTAFLAPAVLAAIVLLALFCPAAVAQQFGPWSTLVNLGSTVNSACDDQHPTLSKDGLSLIFSSTRPQNPNLTFCDVALHLWASQRDSPDSPWETPQPLTMLNSFDNSPFQEHAPNLTTDGHWLFFHSSRADGSCNGGVRAELWAAHRQDKRNDFGWETPINLGCTLNISGADDAGPNFWEDDTTGTLFLYFTRNLTPANPDGFSIYLSTCNADLDSCNRQQFGELRSWSRNRAVRCATRVPPSAVATVWK
jgi:hypothetical protein